MRCAAVRAVGVDVVDRGQRAVGRAGGGLDRLAAPGEPVEHADHAADLPALLLQRLDRGQRRAARRDDVLDHHAAVARRRAAGPRPGAAGRAPWRPCARRTPSRRRPAGERGAGDRVGAHRHAADRRRVPLGELRGEQRAERGERRRAQDRALGVDVVLRLAPLVSVTLPITRACSRSSATSARVRGLAARSYVRRARSPRAPNLASPCTPIHRGREPFRRQTDPRPSRSCSA